MKSKVLTLNDITSPFAASLDVIIVLGGGAPSDIISPPEWTKQRCDAAANIYMMANEFLSSQENRGETHDIKNNEIVDGNGRYFKHPCILALSAGTAHVPQFYSVDGLPVWESTSSAAYILDKFKNIPPSKIFVETTSYDTISNAFFARTSHTDIAGWKKILVITNEFHMERSKVIFDWVFSLKDKDVDIENQYVMHYLSCPDKGLDSSTLRARYEHEEMQRKKLELNLVPRITTLQDLWSFLNEEHDFYTAAKLVQRGKGKIMYSSKSLKGSYAAEQKSSYIYRGHKGLLLYSFCITLFSLKMLFSKKHKEK